MNRRPILRPYSANSNKNKPNRKLLTYALIPDDIKQIAENSLGRGVLEALWRSRNSADTPLNLMWKIVDGRSVGFALYHFELIERNSFKYRVGVIDLVCVDGAYRHHSYGAMITYYVIQAMAKVGVNRIELLMRAPSAQPYDDYPSMPIIGSERFLYNLGFKKIAYLPNFWKTRSQRYKYACNMCKSQPDSCLGILMALNGR